METTATPVTVEIIERIIGSKRIRCVQCPRSCEPRLITRDPIRVVIHCPKCGITNMLYPIELPEDLITLRLRLV